MAQVPSNLIPTTITQLPTVPVASAESWVLITYQGKSYKITAGNLVGASTVPVTRQIIAGTCLTGGGTLASDVTLGIANNSISSVQLQTTGVTAGVYGGSSSIPVLTIDSTGRVTSASTSAVSVSSLTGGSANRIPYQINSTTTDFIATPTVANTVLTWNGVTFAWQAAASGSGTVTSVSATAPLVITGSPTVNPTISMPPASSGTSGYLTGTDWAAFNNKQATLVSGTNIKTINSNSLLGSGDLVIGGVSSVDVSGTGTGMTFTGGPITGSGVITMSGTLDVDNGGTGSTTAGGALSNLGGIGTITSTDGSVTVSGTGTSRDLSVAVAGSTTNVICLVRNTTGATLTKGTAVYINGATGQNPTIAKALATSDATSAQTLGLMTADLANNSNGYVTIIGLITNMDTSAYTDGAQLYLSYTTAGALTATKPKAPNHMVYVAVVEHAHPTQGKLFVKVQNGYELDELHDVQITSPANGQTIIYDATTSLWKNANLTAGSGVSITNGAGSVTISATGSGGTVTSVSGTGTVNGLTLSGTVTGIGDLTLAGPLDLSSAPAIGGTTPAAGTFTTVTAPQVFAKGDGTNSGSVVIRDPANAEAVTLTVPTGLAVNYTLTLPSTAGSANQVLKTDGTGNTDWTSAITLNGISDPTAPTGTNTKVYSKSFGGYPTLAGRNALNTSFGLQSALWSKNIQMWTTTAATAGLWLNASGSSNGTFTNVNPTVGSTLYQTVRRSTYANLITTTNQVLGIVNGQSSFFRGSVAGQGGYFFYARCGFDVWTNGGRFFAGMTQASSVISANPTGTNNTAGFAVEDTDAGAISFITKAGSTATKTAVGLTITSNKGYDCYIYCSPNASQITWQIIDINTGTSVTGTATTNLPTTTQVVSPMVLASNAALTPATSISIGIAKIYVESDY